MASLLLPTILEPGKSQPSLVLLQSTAHASAIPLLRRVVKPKVKGAFRSIVNRKTVVFCLFYPPAALLHGNGPDEDVEIYDLSSNVPGYGSFKDPRDAIRTALNDSQPTTLVIDSIETLQSDIGNAAAASAFLIELVKRPALARGDLTVVLHTAELSSSALVSSILHYSLPYCKNVSHITVHSPELITHVASEYGTPPPPVGNEERFWGIWLPVSARQASLELPVGDVDTADDEIVVEVISRGAVRRRAVERRLEGWDGDAPCELTALRSLKRLHSGKGKASGEEVPTGGLPPEMNVSFNLALSEAQQQARAKVPLPYAHEGQQQVATTGAILYDPDSADDIDDDDPDEDLDI